MRVAVEVGVHCVTLLGILRPTRDRRLATFDRADLTANVVHGDNLLRGSLY